MKKILICLLVIAVLCGCVYGYITYLNSHQGGENQIIDMPINTPIVLQGEENPLDFQILSELEKQFSSVTLMQDGSLIQVYIFLTEAEENKLTNGDVIFDEYFPSLLSQNIINQAKEQNFDIILIIKYATSNFAITYNAMTQDFFDFEMETVG